MQALTTCWKGDRRRRLLLPLRGKLALARKRIEAETWTRIDFEGGWGQGKGEVA